MEAIILKFIPRKPAEAWVAAAVETVKWQQELIGACWGLAPPRRPDAQVVDFTKVLERRAHVLKQ
jgi:hypothetical protein